MKYIKTFEKVEKTKDLKKLFNHIVDVFSEYYGYNTFKYENGMNEVQFYNIKHEMLFTIQVSPYEGRYLNITANDITTDICSYILHYFDTIIGIKQIEKRKYSNYYIILDKNIDNIINQISKEDFDMKYNTNKFNI